jgi:hypothetical protein
MIERGDPSSRSCHVETCRVGIPIDEVHADRDRVLAEAFSPDERSWAAGAMLQTLAGRVAAKRALNGLAGLEDTGLAAWFIATDPDGAPRVVASPDGCPERWRLSISHSRTTAWALAARSEERGDFPISGEIEGLEIGGGPRVPRRAGEPR